MLTGVSDKVRETRIAIELLTSWIEMGMDRPDPWNAVATLNAADHIDRVRFEEGADTVFSALLGFSSDLLDRLAEQQLAMEQREATADNVRQKAQEILQDIARQLP